MAFRIDCYTRFACTGLVCLSLPFICAAAETNLPELTIEQLINIEITSVSKKEKPLSDSPAAVAVLTSEDIRHLGATSLPEALRVVPGVDVARIDANKWAVSVRGFNDEFANKLLVMLDGRSIYTPSIGGVNWNEQDVVLDDIERIEVVRGPGGTLWGANAVNGVINIITKSARDTQGFLASTTLGTEDQPSVSLRYGGKLATNIFYRVYAKGFNRDGFDDVQGHSLGDDWRMGRGGLRMDWDVSASDTVTLQADYFKGEYGEQVAKQSANPPAVGIAHVNVPTQGGDALGRWTRKLSDESDFSFQVYYDRYEMSHAFGGAMIDPVADVNDYLRSHNAMSEVRDTIDVDFQHRFSPFDRHDFIWGTGYRFTQDQFGSRASNIRLNPDHETDHRFNAFVQDEIALVRERLALTLGTKYEHNEISGSEFQPGGRLMWTPNQSQSVWASVARAVRTPTRMERTLDAGMSIFTLPDDTPVLVNFFGNPNLRPEKLIAYELGYRIKPATGLSFDVAGFYNQYDDLIQAEASSTQPGSVVYANSGSGDTYGAELLAQWQVVNRWRLTGAYTWLRADLPHDEFQSTVNPEHQFNIHSQLELSQKWTLDSVGYFFHRTDIHSSATDRSFLPGYFRLDMGLTWRPNPRTELSLWGQNLLDEGHVEFWSVKTPNVAEVPRSLFAKFTVHF